MCKENTIKEQAIAIANAMKSENCTNGWDMVCCYDETHINKLLKEKYQKGHMSKEITMTTLSSISELNVYFSTQVTLKLGEPEMTFGVLQDKECNVIMAIEGGMITRYWTDEKGERLPNQGDNKSIEIPENKFCIKAEIPITAVSGSMIENGKRQDAVTSNTVIEFGKNEEEFSIILDFEHSNATYQLQDMGEGNKEAENFFETTTLNDLQKELQNYFINKIDSIQYQIGGLSAKDLEDCNMYPKSFVFAVSNIEKDKKNRSSLNIYIQIVDSLDEEKCTYPGHKGDAAPSFQPGGKKMLSFPEKCNASIIFSHELMEDLYFKTAFDNQGWNIEKGDEEGKKTEGIVIKMKKNNKYTFDGTPKNSINTDYKMDSGEIDFNQYPLILTLKEDKASVSWDYKSSDLSYKAKRIYANIGGESTFTGKIRVDGRCVENNNVVKLTNSNNDEISWKISVSPEIFNMTGVVVERRDEYWIHDKTYPELFRRNAEKAAKNALPSFEVTLKSLKTFIAGNILFPGKNIFSVVADAGYYAPRDFIIFGKLTESFDETEEK